MFHLLLITFFYQHAEQTCVLMPLALSGIQYKERQSEDEGFIPNTYLYLASVKSLSLSLFVHQPHEYITINFAKLRELLRA